MQVEVGLGRVYQTTEEDGTVVRAYDYSAFNEITVDTGTFANPFTTPPANMVPTAGCIATGSALPPSL